MKKIIKLMALITALTFCIGTTVFASDTTNYVSPEKPGSDNMGDDGQNDDQGTGLDDESEGDSTGTGDESEAGGTASPQTSASIAPIVAMAGLAAAGAATALKRK